MNPITTVAASCTRLSPLSSPNCSPRTSPWQSPIMAYKFGQTLTVPANESHRTGGRRGSHDKRELFAYADEPVKKDEGKTKKKKKNRFEISKPAKDKPGKQIEKSTTNHSQGEQKKKRLKDVAKELKNKEGKESTREAKNKKNCVLM